MSDITRLPPGSYHGERINHLAFNGLIISYNQYSIHSSAGWHYHANPHFTLILKGKSIEKRGRNTIHCLPGALLFYPAQELHCNEGYQQGCKNLSIEMEMSWLAKYDLKSDEMRMDPLVSHAQVKINFTRMLSELKQNDSVSGLGIEGLLLQSLASIQRDNIGNKNPLWVKMVKELLHENPVDALSLSQIGKIVGVHPVTLSKAFPRYFHCTTGEYIRSLKVEKAIGLLGKRGLSIDQIALQCGFSDASHFGKVLRRHTGLTASRYRALL